jgi:hypothetical protein
MAAAFTVMVVGGIVTLRSIPVADAVTAPKVFEINTNSAAADANRGDGVCSVGPNKECSLRAAIEEGNEISDLSIPVEIRVAPSFTGKVTVPALTTAHMATASPVNGEASAFFHIKRKMTIDLDHRLAVYPEADSPSATGFWVDAPGVKLLNFSDVYSNETTYVFSPNSDGSILEGGASVQVQNHFSERMAAVLSGADGITIRNYKVGRLYGARHQGAISVLRANGDNTPVVSNLTISGLIVDNSPRIPAVGRGDCSAQDGSTCSVQAFGVNDRVNINKLVIDGSKFTTFPSTRLVIDMELAGDVNDLAITNNEIKAVATSPSYTQAAVVLPLDRRMTGNNRIAGNTFDNGSGLQQGGAIFWNGMETSNLPAPAGSNLFIEDNHFNGYQAQTILMYETGTVTIRRNTFGTSTGSRPNTLAEETVEGSGTGSSAMVMNYGLLANRKVGTWYPTKAVIDDSCLNLLVDLEKPGNGVPQPNPPVSVDVYYTKERTAEVLLGTVTNLTGKATVTMPLPPEPGFIRVQTQGPSSRAPSQFESSQFSRAVQVEDPKRCGWPQIQLRAWQDVDPSKTDHNSIIATATEVPSGGPVDPSKELWFTYTVANNGYFSFTGVEVKDSLAKNSLVCKIPSLSPGASAGCSRRQH